MKRLMEKCRSVENTLAIAPRNCLSSQALLPLSIAQLCFHMPLAVAESTDPICSVSPVGCRLRMFSDSLNQVSCSHAPVMTHKPLHRAGAHHFCPGQLGRCSEWPDNVVTDVVHATLLDETIEEPQRPREKQVWESERSTSSLDHDH